MLFSTEADAEAALRRLKFDRGTIRAAKALLAFRTAPLAEDRPAVRRMLRKLGPAAFRRLLAMRAAYGEPLAGVERALGEVLEEGDCWSLDTLAVKGGDLLAAGVPAGPGARPDARGAARRGDRRALPERARRALEFCFPSIKVFVRLFQ